MSASKCSLSSSCLALSAMLWLMCSSAIFLLRMASLFSYIAIFCTFLAALVLFLHSLSEETNSFLSMSISLLSALFWALVVLNASVLFLIWWAWEPSLILSRLSSISTGLILSIVEFLSASSFYICLICSSLMSSKRFSFSSFWVNMSTSF